MMKMKTTKNNRKEPKNMRATIKELMPEIVIDPKAYVEYYGNEIDTNILKRSEVEIMNEIRTEAANDVFNAVIERFYDKFLDREFHSDDAKMAGFELNEEDTE